MRHAVTPRSGCSGGDAEAARPPGRDDDSSAGRRAGLRTSEVASSSDCVRTEVPARESQLRPDGAAAWPASNCVWTESGSRRVRRTGCPTGSGCAAGLSPGPARCGRAPRPGPLQGPVHRLRRASTTSSSGCGPSCAPRCPTATWRAIIEQAVTEKLQRLEARRFAETQTPRKTLVAERDLPHDAPDPGRGEASRVRAGRRPMPLRGRTGKTMHGAPGARVPPPAPVRPRRRPLGR